MTAIPVTVVTQNATYDSLSDTDYRDIYDELRGRNPESGLYMVSLDKFVTMVTSRYSKALWAKYHNGDADLNRTQRSELRAAVGLPPLPPTVEDVAASVNPDALVVKVGEETTRSVILVGTSKTAMICVNGAITARETTEAESAHVTPVTSSQRKRRRYHRPVATPAQEARRVTLDVGWQAVIEAGLKALEKKA